MSEQENESVVMDMAGKVTFTYNRGEEVSVEIRGISRATVLHVLGKGFAAIVQNRKIGKDGPFTREWALAQAADVVAGKLVARTPGLDRDVKDVLESLVGTDKSVKDIKAIYNALGEEARGQVDAAAQTARQAREAVLATLKEAVQLSVPKS